MNILLIGSGGREHALAWKISQSPKLNKLFIAPGNAGTALIGINADLSPGNFEEIKKFVINQNIKLVIVGPEDPLVHGIHNYFLEHELLRGIPVIGPVKEGALLEGSKDFAKIFMKKYNIPTAKYKSFSIENIEDGYTFLDNLHPPYVLKADGLAAGKGVIILSNLTEAKLTLAEMLRGKFGEASNKVVVEEFLDGIELSVFVLTDGKNYKILPEAKDYKRIGENNTGPNTGGMGAVSPVPFADKIFMQKVEDRIIRPTVKGLLNEGINYTGFIFFGLINVKGEPMVIEYNARMGDPETEAVIPRIKNDFIDLLLAVAEKRLDEITLEIDERTVVTVVLVSEGYPEQYAKGKQISGFENITDGLVFHAGTKFQDGEILTNGGRVICLSSYGQDILEARELSYENAEKIMYQGKNFRRDIGLDLLPK